MSSNDNFLSEEDALLAKAAVLLSKKKEVECEDIHKDCSLAISGSCPHINSIMASVFTLKR